MKALTPIATFVALALTMTLSAGQLETVHLLPIAGHTDGANGTFWRTDLSVFNPGSTAITLEILFIERGEGRSENLIVLEPREGESLTVPPRSSVRLSDILGREGLENPTGSLIIGANEPFVLTSRSFTTSDSGGTFGQTVPPAGEFIHQAGEKLLLPVLSASDGSRTNVGVVAAADGSRDLVVEVGLLDSAGTLVGSRMITIPSSEINQLQVPVTEIEPSLELDTGAIQIEIISGSGAVTGYASVVDNVTGDAVLVSAASQTLLGSSTRHTDLFTILLSQETER